MSKIILYDGTCNLCHFWVNFAKRRTPPNTLSFRMYQESPSLLSQYPEIPKDMSTVSYLDNGALYLRSTAILKAAKELNSPYNILYAFSVIPLPVRDAVYNYIAARRYQWFGSCECPSNKNSK